MKTPQRNDNQDKGPIAELLDYILEKLSSGFTSVVKFCVNCSGNSRINDRNVYNMMTPEERGLPSSSATLFSGSGFGAMDMESMDIGNDNSLKSNQSLTLSSNNFSKTQSTANNQTNDNILRLSNDEKEESFINNNTPRKPICFSEQSIYSSDNSVDLLNKLDIVEITPSIASQRSNTPLFDDSDYIDISDNNSDGGNNTLTF